MAGIKILWSNSILSRSLNMYIYIYALETSKKYLCILKKKFMPKKPIVTCLISFPCTSKRLLYKLALLKITKLRVSDKSADSNKEGCFSSNKWGERTTAFVGEASRKWPRSVHFELLRVSTFSVKDLTRKCAGVSGTAFGEEIVF